MPEVKKQSNIELQTKNGKSTPTMKNSSAPGFGQEPRFGGKSIKKELRQDSIDVRNSSMPSTVATGEKMLDTGEIVKEYKSGN